MSARANTPRRVRSVLYARIEVDHREGDIHLVDMIESAIESSADSPGYHVHSCKIHRLEDIDPLYQLAKKAGFFE